jgi:hypothetical protein
VDCIPKILNKIGNEENKDIILIFEDAKKHYINIRKYVDVKKEVIKDGVFKYAVCNYFGKRLKILDIKNIIPYKFYEYTDKFNLKYDVEYKDVENLGFNKIIKANEEFIKLCENYKVKIIKNSIIYDDLIKEASYYKCLIMRDGYNKLLLKVKNEFGFNLNNYCSFNGIIKDNLLKKCYLNSVYQVSGPLKNYIYQSVVGGRVMTLENKQHEINEDVTLLDLNSCYTAAMCRDDFKGFPLGEPKKIETTDYNIIKNYDMYYVTIKIIKVQKHLKNPLISLLTEEHRINTNEAEGKIITVDRYTLEDYIKYQNIKFEIIGGIYYNNGFNDEYKKEYINLYEKKAQTKDILYKLFLNSSYGLFLSQHDIIKTEIFKNETEFNKYLTRNPERVESFNYINGTSKIIAKIMKVTNKNDYNYVHIGSIILAIAKRINNEIITLAEDNNINIYYQSTDSILLKSKDVEKLKDLYKLKYGRELIGNNLGQMKVEEEGKRAIILGKNKYIIERKKYENINLKYRIRCTGAEKELIDKINKMCDVYEKFKQASEGEGFILLEKEKENYIINRNGEINKTNNKYIKINV